MRPRRYLERNRDCVRTGFAPGRPPPVHPRPTGACAAMRGFQICVSEPRANAKAALGMARAPSFFTMSNSPLRGLVRAARLFPATHFCARVVASCCFVSTASPLHLPALRRARAQIHGVSAAPAPNEGGRSAERRTISFVAFARRDWSARVRRGASHDAGRSPLGAPPWRCRPRNRSGPGIICGSGSEAARSQPLLWRATAPGFSFHGLRAAIDATPRSACWIVSGDAPHERGWQSIYHIHYVVNI